MRCQALLILAALGSMACTSALATDTQPRRFVIEVTTSTPGQEQTFKAALGHAGKLELIEAKTPFKREFTATSLTMMFEVVDENGSVVAQLSGERDGKMTFFGNVGGKIGKITDDPFSHCERQGFTAGL